MNLKRLFQRYNPRRKYIDMEDELISLMSQLGYIELYRGEWFFTDDGVDFLVNATKDMEKHNADVRSRV